MSRLKDTIHWCLVYRYDICYYRSFSGLEGKEINNYLRFSFYLSYHIYIRLKQFPEIFPFLLRQYIYCDDYSSDTTDVA